MRTIEYIFIPSRTYRGEVEIQLNACTSLEEAHDLVCEKAGDLFTDMTPEEMREIINEGPKENVYSLLRMFSTPDDHPDVLLYYPDGNGNWPIQILKIKLKTPITIE